MTLTLPEDRPDISQSMLAWAYSIYAGVFAFLFSIFIFSPLSGARFAAMSAVSAFICVRIASWLASYFGRSGYGLVACIIATVVFPLVPPIVVMTGGAYEFLIESGTGQGLLEYTNLSAIYYLAGVIYTAPATFSATAIFQLALFLVRKLRWLNFEQKWI